MILSAVGLLKSEPVEDWIGDIEVCDLTPVKNKTGLVPVLRRLQHVLMGGMCLNWIQLIYTMQMVPRDCIT